MYISTLFREFFLKRGIEFFEGINLFNYIQQFPNLLNILIYYRINKNLSYLLNAFKSYKNSNRIRFEILIMVNITRKPLYTNQNEIRTRNDFTAEKCYRFMIPYYRSMILHSNLIPCKETKTKYSNNSTKEGSSLNENKFYQFFGIRDYYKKEAYNTRNYVPF